MMMNNLSLSDNESVALVFTGVAAVLGVVSLVWVFRSSGTNRLKKKKKPFPPGPPSLPVIGNAHQVVGLTTGGYIEATLLTWALQYGQNFVCWIPLIGPMIVASEPALARRVMVQQNYPKAQPFYQPLAPLFGNRSILLEADNEQWLALRKAFHSGFTSPDFLRTTVLPIMTAKLQRFLHCLNADIDADEATPLLQRAQTFTADVIVQIVMGQDWGGDRPHEAREWLNEMQYLLMKRNNNPLINFFGVYTNWRIWQLQRKLNAIMQTILDQHLLEQESSQEAPNKPNDDICALALRHLKDKKGGNLTESDKVAILHQLKTFYFAGHDTTASTLSWCLWLLSQHGVVLDKLRAELHAHNIWTTTTSDDNPPTYDALKDCAYLDAVVKETLRLYPPVSGARYCTDADATTDQGYRMGHAIVLVSAHVMHRHPDNWSQPNEFRPERFLIKPDQKSALEEKFQSFSRGPRDCLGKYFALLEIKLAVSAVVMRYDLQCEDPKETVCVHVTAMPKKGARVTFSHRRPT